MHRSRLFKIAIFVFVIVLLQICGSAAMAQIPIGTIEDLSRIGREVDYPLNGSYVLTSDIEAFDTVNWNDGMGFEPIGTQSTPFTGQFNGGGYVIRNLTINRQIGYVGLFAYVDQSGEIFDVGLEGGTIRGSSCNAYVGGLAGHNSGTITNSYTTCSVTVSSVSGDQCDIHAGGLVGYNAGGIIKGTYATGSVAALSGGDEGGNGRETFVGGLIGDNEEGDISDSYSTGAVTANISGSYVGGLIGRNGDDIKDCYATGSVTVSTSGPLCNSCVGGLVGLGGNGSITGCYATGYVSASSDPDSTSSNSNIRIGGLLGYSMTYCDIVQCYATGGVETAGIFTLHEAGGMAGCNAGYIAKSCARGGVKISTPGMYASSSIGGLVGENSTGDIVNCYATGAVSGTDIAGGLVGNNYYGDVSFCYAVGSVDAFDEGGLVGINKGSVTASFWDIDSTGQDRSAGGTGLHFEEMRWQSTYTGWDFGTVWSIRNGATYHSSTGNGRGALHLCQML